MLTAVHLSSTYPPNHKPHMFGAFGLERIKKYPPGERMGRGQTIPRISDGASNTVLLSEVLTHNVLDPQNAGDQGEPGNDDWRGVWMIPSMGASAFTGRFPPNPSDPDVIPACGSNLPASIPCWENTDSGGNIYASARSRHDRGVNAAMVDGSVRFVTNTISQKTWQAMCTRAGGDQTTGPSGE